MSKFPVTTPESNSTIAISNAANALQQTMFEQTAVFNGIYSELSLIRETLQALVRALDKDTSNP